MLNVEGEGAGDARFQDAVPGRRPLRFLAAGGQGALALGVTAVTAASGPWREEEKGTPYYGWPVTRAEIVFGC
jgi:hypothetical protein